MRLHAVSQPAAALGLTPGMTLAAARAAVPDLTAQDAEPEADRAALTALARWCGRWTPWAAPRPAAPGLDAVILETTGCDRVHGGEETMLRKIHRSMTGLGLAARIAAAPTIGLAWGLSWHLARAGQPPGPVRIDGPAARDALAGLSVRALRIADDAADTLEELGLRQVGDLIPHRRADLARRFGTGLVRRLDQARGTEPETLDPVLPAARLRARRRYAEPLTDPDQIARAAAGAAEDLCALLEEEGAGARRLSLMLYRVDGAAFDIRAGTAAPARDAAHLARLLAEQIARAELDPGFGIEIVELAALTAERLDAAQEELTGDQTGVDPARLADRLAARLGEGCVLRPAARASHDPSRAAGWARADGAAPSAHVRADARRPLLMLERPEPVEAVSQLPDGPPRLFVWRRVRHRVAAAEGPERVAPEWWREAEGARRTRDYFRVETDCGRRFWLYRDGVQGRDGAESSAWFVCGAG